VSGSQTFLVSEQPIVSVLNGSAIANGLALDNKSCRQTHTIVAVTSAGVSAGGVQLQGSLDGVSWYPIGAALPTAAASTVFQQSTASIPARFVRATISTAITGGTVTCTIGSC
jgi:hypothetical protein